MQVLKLNPKAILLKWLFLTLLLGHIPAKSQVIDNDSLKILYMNALLKEQDSVIRLLNKQVNSLYNYGVITDGMLKYSHQQYVPDSTKFLEYNISRFLDSMDVKRRLLPFIPYNDTLRQFK